MPNWCANTLSIETTNEELQPLLAEITARFADTESDGKTSAFNYIHPMPEELEGTIAPSEDGDDWYSWRIKHWGTKWPESGQTVVTASDNRLLVCFDTAWAPPFGVYERLVEMGFDVTATYAESGMGFAGVYRNGDNTELSMEYLEEVDLAEILRKVFNGQGLPDELLPPHTGG